MIASLLLCLSLHCIALSTVIRVLIIQSLRMEDSSGVVVSPSKKWFSRPKESSIPLSRQQSGMSQQGGSSSSSSPEEAAPVKLFKEGYLSKMGKAG